MSVVDPVRFFVLAIFICAMLQVFGVMDGPCNPPESLFDYSPEGRERFNNWMAERNY